MKKGVPLMLAMACLSLALCAPVHAGWSGIWKPSDGSNSFYVQTYTVGSCVVIVTPDGEDFHVFLDGECDEEVVAMEYFGRSAALDMTFTSDVTAMADLTVESKGTQYALDRVFEGDCRKGEGAGRTLTNSLGMTFAYIPPGRFTMGSPASEPLANPGLESQHLVTLTKGLYMQTTEVTQGQWKAVMGSNPSGFDTCGDDCPVENVSWEDAQAFIAQLNTLGEGTYRLPTEAEWEYAARAGSILAFSNGDIIDVTGGNCDPDSNLGDMGWYCYNSGEQTHPVAQKNPNPWGLYDMHGNVFEWCQDWFGLYPTGPVTDPTGAPGGVERVSRGGSWNQFARSCRSGYRLFLLPDTRNIYFGFRLARDLAG